MLDSDSRPRLFIGSSKESLRIAQAIQANLDRELEVTVWSQGVFQLSRTSIESLMDALRTYDFAAFVFMPEDIVTMGNDTMRKVRDNVVFELGLFIGRIGRKRTFLVAPRGSSGLHLPTDLLGVTLATFDAQRSDDNLRAALQPACGEILDAVHKIFGKPGKPSGSESKKGFEKVIADHAGVRSETPIALAVDVLSKPDTIRPDVESFLERQGWEMRIEVVKLQGISGPEDRARLVEKLKRKRARLSRLGATEVHLFYGGPVGGALLVGMLFDNWIPVKVYQGVRTAEKYEYWAPLVKT